ncbi:MAG: translation initiation factor IF-2 [Deltaproteobacteria bacterium]|nr:translation initiation factor IF-2 [Deltaproteobacteria bacterium]
MMKVFELAKKLGIEAKELIDKLKEMGIEVRTHASNLSEEDIKKIQSFFGAEGKAPVVEKRIKSTVIRRRAGSVPPPEPLETPKEELQSKPSEEIAPSVPVHLEPVPSKSSPLEPVAPPTALSPAKSEPSSEGISPKKEVSVTPGVKTAKVLDQRIQLDLDEEAKRKARKKKLGGLVEEDEKKLRRRVLARTGGDLFGDLTDTTERLIGTSRKKRRTPLQRVGKKTDITTPKASKRIIKMANSVAVGELAHRMGIKGTELIQKLVKMGSLVSLNQSIDFDTASLVAHEFGFEMQQEVFREQEVLPTTPTVDSVDLKPRPPVVTVMGHVDHGKTTLLDAIRETRVADKEAGGITQHIGAYAVATPKGDVVFLDTPGHEAFTAMRARGAKITDIVILVVAADDGVMPQTREAIDHAKAAHVPIIVAINKIDKPGADPEKVKRGLAEVGLVSEEWGGENIFVPVSAKQRKGVDTLLEMILLQAEVLELKANPSQRAFGTVVEARLDKGRGPVVTVIVQQGTLKVGDIAVCGVTQGRVRALQNDRGERIQQVGPSYPTEVLGLSELPSAGETFSVVANEEDAREVMENRLQQRKGAIEQKGSKTTLEDLYKRLKEGKIKELQVVLKADVMGSVEAIEQVLQRLGTEQVRIDIIHKGVGNVTENDVLLASASDAVVIGFNVRSDGKAKDTAKQEGVEIKLYEIIYELVDEVRKAMEGLLEPIAQEVLLGHAEVRELFKVSKMGTIAGCFVTDGKIARSARIRVRRGKETMFEGKIRSLKRFKDDAREVANGFECGIGVENFDDIQVGDFLEAFAIEETAAKLSAAVENDARPEARNEGS